MSEVCRRCRGRRSIDGVPCDACGGRGLVLQNAETCDWCGGHGRYPSGAACFRCSGSGLKRPLIRLGEEADRPLPRQIKAGELRKALDAIIDDRVSQPDQGSWIHGAIAGLVANLYELTRDPDETKRWLSELLKGGCIVWDYDGLWSEVGGEGVRFYLFVERR